MNLVENVLNDEYGIGILNADPVYVLWAAEFVAERNGVEKAKQDLQAINERRQAHLVGPVVAEYGSKLYWAL